MLTPYGCCSPPGGPRADDGTAGLAFPFMYAKSSTVKQNHTQGYCPSRPAWPCQGPAGMARGRTQPWQDIPSQECPRHAGGPELRRGSTSCSQAPVMSQGLQSDSPAPGDTLLPIQSFATRELRREQMPRKYAPLSQLPSLLHRTLATQCNKF